MKTTSTTQRIVEIADVRDGVIILKNKALRAILMVSSTNFALKSEEEQKTIIYAYQRFLNSLDFPVQIVVQSRKLNIDPYLQILEQKREEQTNELLKIQLSEYIEFIRGLTKISNIMSKGFYLVVPFAPIEAKRESFLEKFKSVVKPAKKVTFTEEAFSRYKEQLWQRIDYIINGLRAVGLKVAVLDTEAILELFYKLYNPE
jgi:hypothetical protein